MGCICGPRPRYEILGFDQGTFHSLQQYSTYLFQQKADSLDIMLILAGYILMHITFGRLILSSRALGSNFWLTTAIISSSILAFLLALPLSLYLEIPLDPISLTEALPFLVCTVGFDKPLRLARAVFSHHHLTTPVKEGKWRGQMKPAGELILEAFDRVGNVILRDYALEVAVLIVGANSKIGGLREFCALAALCLTLDCILLGTFYVSVLSVMVEVSKKSCHVMIVPLLLWPLSVVEIRITCIYISFYCLFKAHN